MISRMFQISLSTSDFCFTAPLTDSSIAPRSITTPGMGTISLHTELCSTSLPRSQGRPLSRATSCRSRRVMSRPVA